MIRLEKITIQGFKSFQRRVSIPFPDGFSVITGPNGSGKTNVGDAIIFVLGKASSKSLRAKKAENLIFHGSKKKKSSDHALVSLHFDNSKRALPFDENSVSISRRINKKGVSTYRLNGRIVTRQQITDVFAQAKVYPDGHNIIKQGDVNNIVDMEPVQRRKIIDEISGIAEYDEKREKAMKELDKISDRVREAEILLTEKTQTIERLKKEREVAMVYKKLEGDVEKIKASILWKDYSKSNESLKDVEIKLSEKTKQSDALEKEIKSLDKIIIEEEGKLEKLTKEALQASSQIEVTNKIAELRFELESKKNKIESNRREIERLESFSDKLMSLDTKFNPAYKAISHINGVQGVLSDLITVPSKYKIAVEVGAGSHLRDIVVNSTSTAVKCVNHLKQNKIGRARFLPLDKIRPYSGKPLPPDALGWISDLIKYDRKLSRAMEFVFSTTACVANIEKAKEIFSKQRVRMVTLDGDLMEASGALTGGFYRRIAARREIEDSSKSRKIFQKEIESLERDLARINRELEVLATKEKKTKTFGLERERIKIDDRLRKSREKRNENYDSRVILQQDIGKLSIQKARLEAKFDNLEVQLTSSKEKKLTPDKTEKLKPFIDMSAAELKKRESEAIDQIRTLGPVNLKAVEDFDFLKQEFDEFRSKVDKILEEKNSIETTISKIEAKRLYTFNHTLREISNNFRKVYKELTNGEAELSLDDPNNTESGLLIKASPPGKKLLNIDSMSGGEKTLTAFSFLFAIQRHKPTPFYILDEADAALDKMNTKKVVNLLKKQSKLVQFIVISHNDSLVREADQIYGVTMENGESKIMGIEIPGMKDN